MNKSIQKQCMSLTKKNNSQCKFHCLPNSDFCGKHQKAHICIQQLTQQNQNCEYINDYLQRSNTTLDNFTQTLNANFNHTLLGIADNWNEIPQIFWYKLDNMWWDIRSLLKIFIGQLNRSDMGKAYPMYPENPFTRNKISAIEINNLGKHINNLNKTPNTIEVNIVLQILFDVPITQLKRISKFAQYDIVLNLIRIFKHRARYKLINYHDSQGNICGYWTNKTEPLSKFEKCYKKFMTHFFFGNGFVVPIETPSLIRLQNELNQMPTEEYIY